MDITSYVTTASMMMSQANVQQQVNISMMKTAMDSAENRSAELLKTMEQSVQPRVGGNIDIKG